MLRALMPTTESNTILVAFRAKQSLSVPFHLRGLKAGALMFLPRGWPGADLTVLVASKANVIGDAPKPDEFAPLIDGMFGLSRFSRLKSEGCAMLVPDWMCRAACMKLVATSPDGDEPIELKDTQVIIFTPLPGKESP